MSKFNALLLDRDGTLILDKHYLSDPGQVELFPDVGAALRPLGAEMRFFVVSNQSGVGRGLFSENDVRACNARLKELLAKEGVTLADIVYCPHRPEENCLCRKPGVAMWRYLQRHHDLEAATTVMVGDKVEDIVFAAHAGLLVRALVETGKGKATAQCLGLETVPDNPGYALYRYPTSVEHPHVLARSLRDAVQGIMAFTVLASEADEA